MAMPFNKINIGDIFESPLKWTGSEITYTVIDKDKSDRLIEIRPSYQSPGLAATLWKKSSDRIFTKRIYCAKQED